jgi:hypothetical protein
MKRVASVWIVVAGFGLLALPARAGLFGSKEKETPSPTNVTRRYHLRIPDKATEKELLQQFSRKAIVVDEIQALRQMIEEKRMELSLVDKQFSDQFAMKSDSNYHYDPATKTVYLLVPKPGSPAAVRAAGGTNAAPSMAVDSITNYEQRVHVELKTDDQVKIFTQLAIQKRYVGDAMKMLALLYREKQAQLDRVDKTLGDKFSLSRDRQYEYDQKSMRLYEIVRVPQKGSLPRESTELPPLLR